MDGVPRRDDDARGSTANFPFDIAPLLDRETAPLERLTRPLVPDGVGVGTLGTLGTPGRRSRTDPRGDGDAFGRRSPRAAPSTAFNPSRGRPRSAEDADADDGSSSNAGPPSGNIAVNCSGCSSLYRLACSAFIVSAGSWYRIGGAHRRHASSSANAAK